MADSDGKHVFISYVKEDGEDVDSLCDVLQASQIPYWRDRTSLGPGDEWKVKIRDAIRSGSLVFLACFSDNSRGRAKTHMNEELNLAIEEFRKMAPGQTWIIPIRFDDGQIPEWELGPNKMLGDLNYVDLFDPGHMKNMAELITKIHQLIGERQLDAATTLAAVDQATAANRVELLTKRTKEMLPDPQREIELHDLVSQEVRRITDALSDDARVAVFSGSTEDQLLKFVREAEDLWQISQPFVASLHVAARWGRPEALDPWADGLRSIVKASTRQVSGSSALIELRHVPGVIAIMAAAMTCVAGGKWDNLRALLAERTIKDRYQEGTELLFEATYPYKPFDNGQLISMSLAHSAKTGENAEEMVPKVLGSKMSKLYTPASEWLHEILKPFFQDQLADEETYDDEFDRAEIFLSLLAQDAANVRADSTESGQVWIRSHWVGRTSWRAAHRRGNPLAEFTSEVEGQGERWRPLQAGLFGGQLHRAGEAIEKFTPDFQRMAQSRF